MVQTIEDTHKRFIILYEIDSQDCFKMGSFQLLTDLAKTGHNFVESSWTFVFEWILNYLPKFITKNVNKKVLL